VDPKLVYWTAALTNLAVIIACLLSGAAHIRRGDLRGHRHRMLGAAALVALFLVSYALKLVLLGREDRSRCWPVPSPASGRGACRRVCRAQPSSPRPMPHSRAGAPTAGRGASRWSRACSPWSAPPPCWRACTRGCRADAAVESAPLSRAFV
jgi:hypothetical protein